ncbi:hypothetical protein C8Q75DRAFT_801423 [Abortiporus biennis]|nr:hypothetical protein C8Q75DRAFT_801423 [Abortiporus biennis]
MSYDQFQAAILTVQLAIDNKTTINMDPQYATIVTGITTLRPQIVPAMEQNGDAGVWKTYPDNPRHQVLGAVTYTTSDDNYDALLLFYNASPANTNLAKVTFIPHGQRPTDSDVIRIWRNPSYSSRAVHSYWDMGAWVMLTLNATINPHTADAVANFTLSTTDMNVNATANEIAAIIDQTATVTAAA